MRHPRYFVLAACCLLSTAIAAVQPLPESLVPLAKRHVEVGPVRPRVPLDEHFNHRVNSDNSGFLQNEEQACMSPVDLDNCVAVWRDWRLGYRRVGFGFSTDGGATWEDALFPAMYYPWQSDPLLVVDDSGAFTANMISLDPVVGGEDGLIQVTSTDGGRTWHDSVWAAHATVPVGFEDKQMLTLDTTQSEWRGSFYCVWTHFYGLDPYDSTHIWFTAKRPGEPYGDPVVLSNQTAVQWPNVCVGPEGEIYVSWCSYWDGGIKFVRSTDGGLTWTDETLIQSTNMVSASVDPNLLIFAYGVLASDHSQGPHHGRLYMLFTDVDPGFTDSDVWLVYSDDGGDTWSARIRMDDETESFPVDQFHPWISIDEDGRVWVVFYDRRNDPNNLLMDVYFTVSTDGGATWRDNQRITTVSSDPGAGSLDAGLIGEYIGWHARGGQALAVWTDTRLGNQDAFASMIDSVFALSSNDPSSLYPLSFFLSTFPNPTNSAAILQYSLPTPQAVTLRLYNVNGQLLREANLGPVSAGDHRYALDLSAYATGLYLAELTTPARQMRTKIVLLK